MRTVFLTISSCALLTNLFLRLLDVVHLAYEWLKKQRNEQGLSVEDRSALNELLATSERRVRKVRFLIPSPLFATLADVSLCEQCLKLLAFYSKVFTDSSDKHCVYHLFTQLEALPDWAVMAAQREGEMTDYEPLPAECALTDVELDWYVFSSSLQFRVLLRLLRLPGSPKPSN